MYLHKTFIALLTLLLMGSLPELNGFNQIPNQSKDNLVVTRAALDIGSGDTKITVADVDITTNKIIKIWHQSYKSITFRKDLNASPNNCLSDKIERELINAIQSMQLEVCIYAPEEWVAIGTSVFRTAENGQDFLEHVKTATGLEIILLPQEEEGELGFETALAVSNESPEDIMVWDSGSGSFQITSLQNDTMAMYGAEFGSVPALEELFANRGLPFSKISPNPVSVEESLKLIEIIRSKLPPIPQWLSENNKKVVTIGQNCMFSRAMIATGRPNYTKQDILEAIYQNCNKTDEELIHFIEPQNTLIGFILMYAVMDHCGFDQLHYFFANGSCEGLLVTPRFWHSVMIEK